MIESAPSGEQRDVELGRGGAAVEAPVDASAALQLRRSAADFSVDLGALEPGEEGVVRIPPSPGPPWHLGVASSKLLSVCGLEP